jgi:hypothetical protein
VITPEFESFFLVIDQITSVSDAANLAVLTRGVDADFSITSNVWYSANEGHLLIGYCLRNKTIWNIISVLMKFKLFL